MSQRFRLDKNDTTSILKGAVLALTGAAGTYALVKINTIFQDDATKLFLAAVVTVGLNAIRKFCSKG